MKQWLLLCIAGICSAVPFGYDPDLVNPDNPEEAGYFEGDIELEPGEEPWLRNVVGDRHRTWPNGVVPYQFEAGKSDHEKQVYVDAMRDLEKVTAVNGKRCIHFRPRHGDAAYMLFGNGSGCHTGIGYNGKERRLNLGRGCAGVGIVQHEILHSLGFMHEQSRHDRDQYVIIYTENIAPHKEFNFHKYDIPIIDELGQPYDYDSLMHYGYYAFTKAKGLKTLDPKVPGVVLGQRDKLTPIDIKEIQILYGCIPGPHTMQGSGGWRTSPPETTTAKPTTHLPANAHVCTFDHGICDWTQEGGDDMQWVRHRGATSTSGTGPTSDHNGNANGIYLYMEASRHTGDIARLDSKVYQGGDYCFDFYYHMYGASEGSLTINLVVQGSNHVSKTRTWRGDQHNQWHHQKEHFAIHSTSSFKFQIQGHIGNGERSDIAIDDIAIYPGGCH